MAKLQQLQFNFDFDTPINQAEQEQNAIEETVIVVNETPINVEQLVAPIEKEDSSTTYSLKKPSTNIYATTVEVKNNNATRGRKSIKAMAAEADLINIPPDEELFSKQYYTMSVVTQMFNVNHSLLRYWESEFKILQPRKNRKGDRLFRPEDIKNVEIIYHLLRVKKYTIEGAKDYFKNQKQVEKKFEAIQQLEQMKQFLLQVKANLS